jgi:hypothetical protein
MKRLFAISMSAWHLVDGQPEYVLQSVVAMLIGDAEIDEDTFHHAYETFPKADGWSGHQIAMTEIPQGMAFGPYRLTWHMDEEVEK